MKSIHTILLGAGCLSALIVSSLNGTAIRGLPSDPFGIYALVEQAALLPDSEHPQSIDLRGAFGIAEGGFGDYVRAPRWGRLVLTAPEGKLEECLPVWRDLVRVAGKGTIVGFSSRYEQKDVEVCAPDDAHPRAGVMATGWSLRKVENVDWGPARDLNLLCRPIAPVGVDAVSGSDSRRAGAEIGFSWKNCANSEDGLRYIVAIERAGESFASPLITGGDGTTSWKTTLALVPGETVRWSVQAVHPKGVRAPIAAATFTVGKPAEKGR